MLVIGDTVVTTRSRPGALAAHHGDSRGRTENSFFGIPNTVAVFESPKKPPGR
jgi:hypothetical protein